MIKPINLFSFTRCKHELMTPAYICHHLGCDNKTSLKRHEYKSLQILVDNMVEQELQIAEMDGFFWSYNIPQIDKEFDLLKMNEAYCINIELKSEMTDKERIERQLQKNKYYLSQLSRELLLYTVITDTMTCYELVDNSLCEVELNTIVSNIKIVSHDWIDSIDSLFNPLQYLVSPLNTPDRFIKLEYFLNQTQQSIKKKILERCNISVLGGFFLIAGGAGTGKTLLLYDIARSLMKLGDVLVIHCGNLCSGHIQLSRNIRKLRIIPISYVHDNYPIENYDYILIDEAQRIYQEQFDYIVRKAEENDRICVFSLDSKQVLSKCEQERNIEKQILELPGVNKFELKTGIRTNKNLASFIKCVMNLEDKPRGTIDFSGISIDYANSEEEAKLITDNYRKDRYEFIKYTESRFYKDLYSGFAGDDNTHSVIGQEFDNVVVMIGKTFYYSGDILCANEHSNPDYLYTQLLYEALTRARQKLAIVVLDNPILFKKLTSIFEINFYSGRKVIETKE